MMFNAYNAFALELISLAAGAFLVVWAAEKTTCKKLAQIVGYLVLVLSLVLIGCTAYHTYGARNKFSMELKQSPMMQMPGMFPGMMPKMKRPPKPGGDKTGEPTPTPPPTGGEGQ